MSGGRPTGRRSPTGVPCIRTSVQGAAGDAGEAPHAKHAQTLLSCKDPPIPIEF